MVVTSTCHLLWWSSRKHHVLSAAIIFLRKSDHYLLHLWTHLWSLGGHHIVPASVLLLQCVSNTQCIFRSLLTIMWQLLSNNSENAEPLIPVSYGPHSMMLYALCCMGHLPMIHGHSWTCYATQTHCTRAICVHHSPSEVSFLLIFPIPVKIWY